MQTVSQFQSAALLKPTLTPWNHKCSQKQPNLDVGTHIAGGFLFLPIFSILSISNLFSLHLHNACHSMVLCASFLAPDLVCCCKYTLSPLFCKWTCCQWVSVCKYKYNTIFIYRVITLGLAIGYTLSLVKFKEQKINLQPNTLVLMAIFQWSE